MKLLFYTILVSLIISVVSIAADIPTDTLGSERVLEDASHSGKIARWLHERGIPGDIVVVIIATLPIVELRGAIPVAMHLFDMPIPRSYILCVIGNIIPVPFILLLLGPVSRFLRKLKIFDRFFGWLFARTRRRSETIRKYEELGLIIFVAIPLPVTGAWTGSLAAFLFGLRFWPSFFCALAGVCIAGVIVTTFSALGLIGAIAAAIILFTIATVSIFTKKREP
ncbi:hypothetical protein DRQ36_03335 [bacterium]|nr:MAG: hypothetical protein DRQ36_03335 [bacterium]